MDSKPPFPHDARLLGTLQKLLQITSTDLRPTLDQASTLVGEALRAEKVDVFLFEAASQTLVALGTSDTPVARLQHQLGLDHMPIANDGPIVTVFETGQPYRTGSAELERSEPRGVVEALGVRSQLDVPLDIADSRRGVVAAASTVDDHFTEQDREFLQAVSCWIGLLIERGELFAAQERRAVARGRREAGNELARLTRRQREVATCVAEGLSNEEIAKRLVLVPGTVANHIEGIMDRLGMRNRVQIAVWAVEVGLYRSGEAADEPDAMVIVPETPNGTVGLM